MFNDIGHTVRLGNPTIRNSKIKSFSSEVIEISIISHVTYKLDINYRKSIGYNLKMWIRCTSRLNAGSRIIENNLGGGCLFVFLAPVGGSNPAGPYPNPFPNPAGFSYF